MYENIGEKLKNIASLLLFLGVIIGAIWFFVSFKNWVDYKDFGSAYEIQSSASGISSSIFFNYF